MAGWMPLMSRKWSRPSSRAPGSRWPRDKTYNGGSLASYVYTTTYTVIQIDGSRVVIGINGVVTAAVNIKDLTLVG